MKVYIGKRLARNICAVGHVNIGQGGLLSPRLDLKAYGYGGFDWGVVGKEDGKKQFALALLADAIGDDETAVRLHEHFAAGPITDLVDEGFILTLAAVLSWVVEALTTRPSKGRQGGGDPNAN
jgi:hypothetical protein